MSCAPNTPELIPFDKSLAHVSRRGCTVLRYAKLTDRAWTPVRGSDGAAGINLFSAYDYVVKAHRQQMISTDLQIEIPVGCYGRIAPRSGLAWTHCLDVRAGVIDADYRGNVQILLYNGSDDNFVVEPGDKIAQLICIKIENPFLEEVKETVENRIGEGSEENRGTKETLMEKWLDTYIICPLDLTTASHEWLHSRFRHYDPGSRLVQKMLRFHRVKLSSLRFSELVNRHRSPSYVRYYSAIRGDVFNVYYEETESTELLEQFVTFQAESNSSSVQDFLLHLYLLLSHKSGKCNAVEFYGVPDCGKTWFGMLLCEFMINYGILSNFNRYSQFPFQDCVNRNILLFDEPNVEPAAFETLKLLFAGAHVSANIKYQDYKCIQRTPVVICSNRRIFPDNEAFKVRMKSYHFKRFDFNNVTKRPLPISLYNLFCKFIPSFIEEEEK